MSLHPNTLDLGVSTTVTLPHGLHPLHLRIEGWRCACNSHCLHFESVHLVEKVPGDIDRRFPLEMSSWLSEDTLDEVAETLGFEDWDLNGECDV